MSKIKEIAVKLKDKYNQKYKEWCIENPGDIMNGNLMKIDTMEKTSYCETIEEVIACKVYYEVALRSTKGPNGFRFSKEAVEDLLNELTAGNYITQN